MNESLKRNRPLLRASLAGTAGASLLALFLLLLSEHRQAAALLLTRIASDWGPLFIIVLLLLAFFYLMADRYIPRFIAAQTETALALQNLARAVEQMAARDDAFQREQDVLLNHVARRLEALFPFIEQVQRQVNGNLERLLNSNPGRNPAKYRPRHKRRKGRAAPPAPSSAAR